MCATLGPVETVISTKGTGRRIVEYLRRGWESRNRLQSERDRFRENP